MDTALFSGRRNFFRARSLRKATRNIRWRICGAPWWIAFATAPCSW